MYRPTQEQIDAARNWLDAEAAWLTICAQVLRNGILPATGMVKRMLSKDDFYLYIERSRQTSKTRIAFLEKCGYRTEQVEAATLAAMSRPSQYALSASEKP